MSRIGNYKKYIEAEKELERLFSTEILICDCNSSEHQLIAYKDFKEETVYLSMFLANRTFLKRIIPALKYIFGYKCKFGHFEEIILTERHKDQLFNLWSAVDKDA